MHPELTTVGGDLREGGEPGGGIGIAELISLTKDPHSVDEQQVAGLGRFARQLPILVERTGADGGEQSRPLIDHPAQKAQQPHHAFAVVTVDDCSHVRQIFEHAQAS